ncbi:hypothetical protein D3C72_120410 [compost metagenome]
MARPFLHHERLNVNTFFPSAMMVMDIVHMPFAFYLGLPQGMGLEMKDFTIGFLLLF